MQAGYYVQKNEVGRFEYGLLHQSWRWLAGNLFVNGWSMHLSGATFRERLGVADTFEAAREAALAAST